MTFNKQQTSIIKGIAIVFMIILHVFCGDNWYDSHLDMNDNHQLLKLMQTLKICVGIYTFMVGYGYAFAKYKDFRYSFQHIKKLLVVYWIVLLGLALPAGIKNLDGTQLILNMFALGHELSWVNWFVYFYIWAMIIMPFIGRLIDRRPFIYTAISIGVLYLGEVAIHELIPTYHNSPFLQALFDCLTQSPCMILGYVFARMKVYERIKTPNNIKYKIIAFILLCFTLYLRHLKSGVLGFNLDFFYAPIFIGCVLIIFNQSKSHSSQILAHLGQVSVYMWFIHGLFFTQATRHIYQPLIMLSDNLWVIAIGTITLTYIISIVLKKLVDY